MSQTFIAAAAQRMLDAMAAPSDSVLLQSDVLSSILAHLSPWQVIATERVSHGFRRAAEDNALWRRFCNIHWHVRHERYRLTPQRALAIEADARFKSWRQEFEAAARDATRVRLSAEELSQLTFDYHRKRGAMVGLRFRFCPDGLIDGPIPERLPWKLDRSRRAVTIGTREAPCPPLYASREDDWTWRLENRNVVLFEEGAFDCIGRPVARSLGEMRLLEQEAALADVSVNGAGEIVADGCLADVVAVCIEGEIFYAEGPEISSLMDGPEGNYVIC